MPPTALSFSSTTTGWPSSDNRHAAATPAGPAPRITIGSVDTVSAPFPGRRLLGNDEVIQVQRERQRPERQGESLEDAEPVAQPLAHPRRRRHGEMIRIPNRELHQQETASAHRPV